MLVMASKNRMSNFVTIGRCEQKTTALFPSPPHLQIFIFEVTVRFFRLS